MPAGRPRNPDVAREPNGRAKRNAETINEQQAEKRRALGLDPRDQRAEYPLGVLLARGVIGELDHAAGLRFAALHQIVFGRRSPKSHLAPVVSQIMGAPLLADDPERERRVAEAGEAYGDAWRVLKALPSSRPGHVIENIAIYDRPLRFMDLTRPRSPEAWRADQRDIEALKDATDALARHWNMGKYGDGGQKTAAAN